MNMSEKDTNATESTGPWYRSPYWLLLLPVILFGLWMWHSMTAVPPGATAPIAQASPAKPNPEPTVILGSTGPNLLSNPSFTSGERGWTEYHNSQPMKVTYSPQHGGAALISLNNVSNGVQEIYQPLNTTKGEALEVSGTVVVSRAPLPPSASVGIMLIDASNKPQTVFSVTSANGVGSFPFTIAYRPSGAAKQFVIAVFTGPTTNNTTTIAVHDLKVAKLALSGGAPATH